MERLSYAMSWDRERGNEMICMLRILVVASRNIFIIALHFSIYHFVHRHHHR